MQTIVFLFCLLIIAFIIYAALKKRPVLAPPDAEKQKSLLALHVRFYAQLTDTEKTRFENSVASFLKKVRITGIKTAIEDTDKILVAAAAIIPIFAFPDWEYRNIHEVLIYPGSFNEDFQLSGEGRNILGMVGNGAMRDTMIISCHDLREGFLNNGTANTAIHEFVHLIDSADGSTDGFPEVLLQHSYSIPWLQRMHTETEQIRAGNSDINPYAATSEVEFLAVTSEYFFQQPELMQEKHPELFAMLEKMFAAKKS